MKSWIKKQVSSAYWLATASVFQEAVHQLGSIDGAVILFGGKQYEDVMTLSPWLIPARSLNDLDSDILNKGMVLTSDEGVYLVLAHLRSLLTAGLEGEEVLFRFYDPQVIMPMLALMNEVDRCALLGNLNSWSSVEKLENDTSNVTTYSSQPHVNFCINNEPWWVIKAEHLDQKKDYSKLAHHMERRLWEKLPQVMNKMNQPKQTFFNILQAAEDSQLNLIDAQFMVLANLIVHQSISVDAVSKTLMLSREEEQRLQQLVERTA